ncbi:MAG: hypothetical protein ABI678_05500 [Kofleriaceae bacterium]
MALCSCQRDHAPSSTDPAIAIAKRDWAAQDLILAAGEQAADCPAAGQAMQAVLAAHRNDLVAAAATTREPAKVELVTNYMVAHPDEFPDQDDRWDQLLGRCPKNPAIQAVHAEIQLPDRKLAEPEPLPATP